MSTRIGVLALQGDVREHVLALEAIGVRPSLVRREDELSRIDGLILPGGESSTIEQLMRRFGLFDPVREALRSGLPAYGSCAGMILLAEEILDSSTGQRGLGVFPMTVRRNAFGRQVDSFETDIVAPDLVGDQEPLRAVFIRAPWVERVGEGVEVLARVPEGLTAAGRIVGIRAGALMATSFHPEVASDLRVHREFARLVREAGH